MDAVEAVEGGAAAAGSALVAGGEGGVHEVVAAGALHEVAAGGGHVAELRGGSAEKRLREERVVGADDSWLARSLLRTQAPMMAVPPARMVICVEVEVVDVDERGGVLDAVLHQVDEIGASAEELCSVGGDGVDGLRRGR